MHVRVTSKFRPTLSSISPARKHMLVFSVALLVLVMVWSGYQVRDEHGGGASLPLVAIIVFGFLYLVQPGFLYAKDRLYIFVDDVAIWHAILIPAIMLAAFVVGWNCKPRISKHVAQIHGNAALWQYGCVTSIVGLSLYAFFVVQSGGLNASLSQPHGDAMAWDTNTAYVYYGPWWLLTGIVMMMIAHMTTKLSRWRRNIIWFFIFSMYVSAVLTSSRQQLFSTTIVLCITSAICQRKPVSVQKVFGVLIAVGAGALLVVGYRTYIHLGDEMREAPSIYDALEATLVVDDVHAALRTTGSEFICHAATITTVDETHKYNLGLNWIYLFTVQPIPRLMWPEKPLAPPANGITQSDVLDVTGTNLAVGSAAGMVADIYRQFGRFGIIFFAIAGVLTRRLYERAMQLGSVIAIVSYVMLYAVSLNMFAQSLSAVLVPFTYAIAPAILYHLAQKRRSIKRPSIKCTNNELNWRGAL